jgi:hypothetical protein
MRQHDGSSLAQATPPGGRLAIDRAPAAAPAMLAAGMADPRMLLRLQQSAGNDAVARSFGASAGRRRSPELRGRVQRACSCGGTCSDCNQSGAPAGLVGSGPMDKGINSDAADEAADSAPADTAAAPADAGATPGAAPADAGAAPATTTGATPADAGTTPGATSADAGTTPTGTPAAGPAPGAGGTAPAGPPTITSRCDLAAPDGAPRTRTTIGIGEVVYFTADRPVNWTASQGFPTAKDNQAMLTWEPNAVGSATITATPVAGGAPATMTMTAVAPQSITMAKKDDYGTPPGNAGMHLIMTFAPTNVSFRNLEELEEPGPGTDVTGYFAAGQAAGADVSHHPTPDFERIGDGNKLCCDEAEWVGAGPPYSDGTLTWVIPNNWRRAATSGAGTFFTNTTQTFTITPTGAMTVTKEGQTVTKG